MKKSKIATVFINKTNYTSISNEICRSHELTGNELKVLIFLLSTSTTFNFSIDRMAKQINLSKQTTINAMKTLTTKGFIAKHGNRKTGFNYFVSQETKYKQLNEAERKANPTEQDLLKEIRDLLKEKESK